VVEDTVGMEVLVGRDEIIRTAKKRRTVKLKKVGKKKIRNNHPSVETVEIGEKEVEVAVDSVVEDAIVTIVVEVQEGDRALTPKVKTL